MLEDRNIVDRELQKFKSKSAKLYAPKENIRIRVIGLGWSVFSMTWSKDGEEKSNLCLANHLKKVISQTRRKKIPQKPTVMIPERKLLPVLGRKTPNVTKIDAAKNQEVEK